MLSYERRFTAANIHYRLGLRGSGVITTASEGRQVEWTSSLR